MARTWHHDEKRFHPWRNPKASQKVTVQYVEEYNRRWRSSWRIGFYYVNYCATPGWWVRMYMERPMRREVHMLEAKLRGAQDLELMWPRDKRPHLYYW